MWHGVYVRWMEESRVQFLAERNISFERLVDEIKVDLPVRELNVRYKTPLRMGDEVRIVTRLGKETNKVRLCVKTDFIRVSDGALCASGQVTNVAVSMETGTLLRRWPPALEKALLG